MKFFIIILLVLSTTCVNANDNPYYSHTKYEKYGVVHERKFIEGVINVSLYRTRSTSTCVLHSGETSIVVDCAVFMSIKLPKCDKHMCKESEK